MSADLDRLSVASRISSASSSPSNSFGGGGGAEGGAGQLGSRLGAPGVGIRLLSANVRRLHGALNLLLNDAEREQFIHCLNVYHCRRNVYDLVQTLKVLLDGPEKRQLLHLLRLVIPRSDQLLFDQYTSEGLYLKADFLPAAGAGLNGSGSPRGLPPPGSAATSARSPSPISAVRFRPPLLVCERLRQDFSTSLNGTAPLDAASGVRDLRGELRQVTLTRQKAQEGLGFSIRGGSEHGVGIYVSLVEPGSLAEKEGLRVGDQILKVNDKPLDKVTHAEAVKALKGSKKLDLAIHSVGRIPGGYITNHIYTWVDPQGRSVSPPIGLASHQSSSLSKDGEKRSHLQLLQEGDEKKVNLVLDEGRSLGLMIRGGSEYALGIYITGVDKGSEAESTGLKVGDQILEVNGRSFLNISHNEAVKLLKSSRHLIMTVKDVGRLPHLQTTVGETKWINSCQIGETMVNSAGVFGDSMGEVTTKPSFYKGFAGSQVTLNNLGNPSRLVLEEHARHLLNEPERSTMAYYLGEYKESNISVEALVMALFELLNTHAKLSLLSEVREVISPQDLGHFDNLVLKREIEFMKARQLSATGTGTESYSTISYSDSSSSTESHFTSTTVSSARNTSDGSKNGSQSSINALPDISLDDVSFSSEQLPVPTPPPVSSSPIMADILTPTNQNVAAHASKCPSPEPSRSDLFFMAPQIPKLPPSLSDKDTNSLASFSTTTSSMEDSGSSAIYASVSPATRISRKSRDAHLLLTNQHSIGPFPRIQSPMQLKLPSSETFGTSSSLNSPSPLSPTSHPATPSPKEKNGTELSGTTQHFIMVEVHQPNSEPDVNEVKSLPQGRAFLPSLPVPASILSQLSDNGQTLSEDSGVDLGEAELNAKDGSHLPQGLPLRSPQEVSRTVEAVSKPPGLLEPTSHLIRVPKSAPTLGIAIEGGANTRQPLPRIVTIQKGGSAHNCTKLKVGHVILEVNGTALYGKEHREAARIIAEAFKAKDKNYVDFLVSEFNFAL